MQENISKRSGFMRLALGTGLTAMGTAHLAKDHGSRTLGFAFVMAGAMKVAEGVFLYCPTKALIKSNVKEAMSSTMGEFMGDNSIMEAFNDFYSNNSDSSNGSNKKENPNSKKDTNQKDTLMKAASAVAKAVDNTSEQNSNSSKNNLMS